MVGCNEWADLDGSSGPMPVFEIEPLDLQLEVAAAHAMALDESEQEALNAL